MDMKKRKPRSRKIDQSKINIDAPILNINTREVTIRNVLITSLTRAGGSSLLHAITNWSFMSETGATTQECRFAGDHIVKLQSIEVKEDTYLNLIDASELLSYPDEAENIIGLMPRIDLVIICIRIGRWTEKIKREHNHLKVVLQQKGIADERIIPCFTHADCRSDLPVSVLNEYNQITASRCTEMLWGSFIYPGFLDDNGAEIYDGYIEDSVDRVMSCIWSMDRGSGHKFKITGDAPPTDSRSIKIKARRRRPPAPEIKVDSRSIPESSDKNRNVILIGLSGSGKSSIVSDLSNKYVESKTSLKAVTTVLNKVTDISVEMDGRQKMLLTIGDTIGVGDLSHSTAGLVEQLVTFVHSQMPTLNLMIFTLRLEIYARSVDRDACTLINHVIETLGLNKKQVCFVVTHSDFVASRVKDHFLSLMRRYLKQVSKHNVIFISAPNLSEIDVHARPYFQLIKKKGKACLIDMISRAVNVIPAAKLLVGELERLKNRLPDMSSRVRRI